MAEWSNDKIINFVEDYRSFPCLWMASSTDYKDRLKRSECLLFLKNKYDLRTTKATLNKIKSLRSYFRRVHNEYLSKKKKSGAGALDVPKPSWFLYELLLFILDGEKTSPGRETFTLGPDSTDGDDGEDEEQNDDPPDAPIAECNKMSNKEGEKEPEKEIVRPPVEREKRKNTATSSQDSFKNNKPRKKVRNDMDPENDESFALLRSVNQNFFKRDHISSFGKYVADKIRNLSSTRLQSLAQMRIQEVLFDLEMSAQTHDTTPGLLMPPTYVSPSAVSCSFSTDSYSAGIPSPYPSRTATPHVLCKSEQPQSSEQQQNLDPFNHQTPHKQS